MFNMRRTFASMDRAVAMQPMPEEYAQTTAEILCNDCEKTGIVAFHFVGLKCHDCGSYNTRMKQMLNKPEYPLSVASVAAAAASQASAQLAEIFGSNSDSDDDDNDGQNGDDTGDEDEEELEQL
jgi:hypothetical protein